MNKCVQFLQKVFAITTGLFVLGNILNAKIYFSSRNAVLSFSEANSSLYLLSPFTGVTGTLYLKDNVASTISSTTTSEYLSFDGGILSTGNISSVLTGTIEPAGTDSIALANGDFLDVQSGLIVQDVKVNAGATVTILGQPRFSSQITLGDASSVVQMSITTDLNQTVSGDGTLSLLDDLSVSSGVLLPSKVLNNGKKLILYGGTYSTATEFTTGGTLDLETATSLTESWTFGATTEVYSINGNGNALDLSGNGNIVCNGTTLYLNDLIIRGLSTANALKGAGRVIMSSVVLELADNFVRADGSFTFYGDPCKIITNGSTFQISGSGNEILVDGMILRYDQLDGSGFNPISAVSSGAINFANGGSIQSASVTGDLNLLIYTTAYTFVKNFDLTSSSIIHVINENTANPKTVAINGGGQIINFPSVSGSFFVIDDNTTVTLSNVVLRDFNPSAINYGSSGVLKLGDGVVVEMGSDISMDVFSKTWDVVGNATIDGKGATLFLAGANNITLTGANKTLTFKDVKIQQSVPAGFQPQTASATIKLQDSELFLEEADGLFSVGNLLIDGFVKLTGNKGGVAGTVLYEFTSPGTMTIAANAEFFVDSNIVLKLNPDASADLTFAASKRHFSLAEVGSKMTLYGCSLQTTDTGMALDQGTVQVVDKVTLVSTTNPGAELEFGANLEVRLSAGANLIVDGPLKYQE